jgi:hypothetical protein
MVCGDRAQRECIGIRIGPKSDFIRINEPLRILRIHHNGQECYAMDAEKLR